MALNIGELYATLKLDATNANTNLSNFGNSAQKMGASVGAVGGALTKSVTLPLIAMGTAVAVSGVKLLEFGSDATEMESKFATVFGSMSGEADKWATNFRDKVGGSSVDIKTVLADSQDLMAGMGATGNEGLAMAQKMTMLGTDLASFQNTTGGASGATEKLRAGLLGETENLKSLGIMVNETTIAQQMAINGDSRKFQSLTELEKMEIRMQIATSQSKNAIGDAEKTSGGYANMVRNLQGKIKDLVTEISIKFLPIALEIVKFFIEKMLPSIETYIIPAVENLVLSITKIAKWFTDLTGKQKALILGFGAFVLAIGPIIGIVGGVISVVGIVAGAFATVGGAMIAVGAPIILLIAGLVALGAGIVYLFKTNETFRDNVIKLWGVVKTSIKSVIDNLVIIFKAFVEIAKKVWTEHGDQIMNIVSKAFDFISAVIKTAMGVIKGIILIVTGLITGDWTKVWNGIKVLTSSVVNGIKSIISTGFNLIKSIISTVLSAIGSLFSATWGRIKSSTLSAFNSIKASITSIVNGIASAVVTKFSTMKNNLLSSVNNIKSGIVNGFNNLKNSVTSTVSNLVSGAVGKFNTLKNGVTGVFNSIKSVVSNSINAVKNTFNRLRLSFPKILLPYFSIKGKFSLKPLSVPTLGISWRARGGIFDSPAIVGLGERGREAIVPLEGQSGNIFAQSFIDRIQSLGGSFAMGNGVTVNVNGDVRNPAQFARIIAREIQLLTDRKTRARGR